MIVKAIKNSDKEAVSINQMYFVIKYEESIKDGRKMFLIFDDCRTLSWIKDDYLSIENDSLNNYEKENCDDMICYSYGKLNNDFFVDFYKENDLSINAITELESIIIDVFAEELSTNVIIENLNELGFHGIYIEYQLKAFFKKANKEDIVLFSDIICNKFSDLDENLYEIIVENIVIYKDTSIDNLLTEIVTSPLCSDKVKEMIFDYWT